MQNKLILILFFSFLALPLVSSLDYVVQINSPTNVNEYEGEIIQNLFSATITNNAGMCDITCSWLTSMNTVGSGLKVTHDGGSKTFYFDTKTQGVNGRASYTLTITCDRISTSSAICLSSPETKPPFGPYSFNFLYNGDGKCTTSNENEDCYSASNDCICSSNKKCKEDLTRTQDEMGCTTYCGNNEIESQSETCSNCPSDVGKCEGMGCLYGEECAGGYCVHEKCYDKPYKQGDGFCDSSSSENCKNSKDDCVCDEVEGWRCGASGICETWCGNGKCEELERGICKSDCKWCGDGECSNNENCGSCETDCGVCESSELNEEIISKTQGVIQKGLSESSRKQKIISYSALGLITIFLLAYAYFKMHKHRKHRKKHGKGK